MYNTYIYYMHYMYIGSFIPLFSKYIQNICCVAEIMLNCDQVRKTDQLLGVYGLMVDRDY